MVVFFLQFIYYFYIIEQFMKILFLFNMGWIFSLLTLLHLIPAALVLAELRMSFVPPSRVPCSVGVGYRQNLFNRTSQPVALTIIKLHQSKGIQLHSQFVSQSVSQQISNFLKFCGNFLKAFLVDLKVQMVLTNTAPSSSRLVFGLFYFVGHSYFFVVLL